MKRHLDSWDRRPIRSERLAAFRRLPANWLVLVAVLVAFGLRAYHLSYQSLWRDEVDALLFATTDLHKLLGNFTKTGENGPLYFLLLRFWIGWTGDSEFSLRFFSLFFGTLIVPLMYTVGRWLLRREVGIFAALLAAVSPYFVWYSQEAKMYALLTLLSLLSVYLYLLALERGRLWRWVVYVVVTSLSLYVHFFFALVVVFEGVLFVMGYGRWKTARRSWAVAYAILTLPYLPLAIWQWPTLMHPPVTAYPFLDLGGIMSVLIFAWSTNSGPIPVLFPLVVFVFLLLAGLVLYPGVEASGGVVRAGSTGGILDSVRSALSVRDNVAILVAYLAIPVIGFYLVSLRLPLFTDRYLIIVSPAFYLLLACGLVAVKQRSRSFWGVSLVFVLVACASSIWSQSHTKIKSDFKSAAQYFAAHSDGSEPILFLMPYVQQTFSYYYRSPLVALPVPYTNWGLTSEHVANQMVNELSGDRGIWLLESEAELYDANGLVRAWLDQNYRLVESASFARVILYHYESTGMSHARIDSPDL
ncbi:MAG: hypothetical protein EPO21_01765 [Chloroflexota bacterium]|nr:MAG: hypothetical protein EPO21_01765 [Chloroflexota bacterium]